MANGMGRDMKEGKGSICKDLGGKGLEGTGRDGRE